MKNKKKLFSLISGIYLSLVFHISINFPPIVSDMPIAALEAWPENTVAVFLYHIRVAFDSGYGIGQSIIALLIALFLYYISSYLKQSRYFHNRSLIVLSGIFGCFNVLGLCMYWLDCLPMFFSIVWMIGSILLAIGWAGVFFIAACLLLEIYEKKRMMKNVNHGSCVENGWIESHLFICSFLCIIVAWLPWIISYYPASMDNDVFAQLYSWLYEPANHHPWFSTCVLGICYNIGAIIGNDNFGIFIYVLCRDIILALIYAKCVVIQKEAGYKKAVYYITLLFYAVTPVWGAYAKHAFKDSYAIGLFCLYIINLIIIVQQIEKNALTLKNSIFYGISLILASLFRNNCIYAVLPVSLIVLIVLVKKKQSIYHILIISLCIIIYFGYNYCIVNYFNVIPGSKAEALSIPFQQTARVVRNHGNELSEEEKNCINEILQYDELAEVYDPVISDIVKGGAKLNGDNDFAMLNDYSKLWFRLLLRHPVTYIEAAIGQSYGYYAFTPNLPERSGNWNSGMTIFDTISCAGDFDENFQFHYIDKLGVLRQILHMWAKVWDKIPIVCITDICAIYTWGVILLFYYMCIKKKFLLQLPVIAVGIMILTCIASPVNDCFRYFASVATSYPALLSLIQKNKNV